MTAARVVHLLGGRGPMGEEIGARLSREPGVELRAWSGEEGARSYDAFLSAWSAKPEPEAFVLLAGGRVVGDATAVFADHVTRTAFVVKTFGATTWPARTLVLGSAAELLPDSVYGLAKRTQRGLVETTARLAGARALTLRVHSVVPLARPTRGLFGDLLRQFEKGGAVTVRHLGGARDYVRADQVAAAVAAFVASDAAWTDAGEVIDVGSGRGLRVGDWIDAFASVFGPPTKVVESAPETRDSEIVADAAPLFAALAAAGRLEEFERAALRPAELVARWRGSAAA